jgi:hypothetical protein
MGGAGVAGPVLSMALQRVGIESSIFERGPAGARTRSRRPAQVLSRKWLDQSVLPSQLTWLKGLVDLNGRILELLKQFRARHSAYFSRPRACLKNGGERVPQILVMIKEGLRVAVAFKDKALGVVAVEIHLVLQSPGVFGAHQFRALHGETLKLVKLAIVDFESGDIL